MTKLTVSQFAVCVSLIELNAYERSVNRRSNFVASQLLNRLTQLIFQPPLRHLSAYFIIDDLVCDAAVIY